MTDLELIESQYDENKKFLGNKKGVFCKFIPVSKYSYGLRTYTCSHWCNNNYKQHKLLEKSGRVPKIMSQVKKVFVHNKFNIYYYKVQLVDKIVSEVLSKDDINQVWIERKDNRAFRWHDLDAFKTRFGDLVEVLRKTGVTDMSDTHKENFGFIGDKLVLVDMGCVDIEENKTVDLLRVRY